VRLAQKPGLPICSRSSHVARRGFVAGPPIRVLMA
jgi:hypothetical protein